PSKVDDFTESLRKEYYRYIKNGHVTKPHGNAKLTTEEEDVLIGIALGMTRTGKVMGASDIQRLACDLFPSQTLGGNGTFNPLIIYTQSGRALIWFAQRLG